MIIWISGPTGAGKSSLAKALATIGYATITENIPEESFRMFSLEPAKFCALLQEAIMRSRFDTWRSLPNRPQVVFDRSISEDIHVFCRMHLGSGFLDDAEYNRLYAIACELEASMPRPDLIIFMTAERQSLLQRISQGTHPPIITENIDRQIALYSEWILTRSEDALRVDNTACSLQAVQRLLQGHM